MFNEKCAADAINQTLRVPDSALDLDEDVKVLRGAPFTGVAFTTYKDGSLGTELSYKDGLPDGYCCEWHPNGRKKREWTAVHGPVHGTCSEWFESGNIKAVIEYAYGVELAHQEWDCNGTMLSSRTTEADSPKWLLAAKMKELHRG